MNFLLLYLSKTFLSFLLSFFCILFLTKLLPLFFLYTYFFNHDRGHVTYLLIYIYWSSRLLPDSRACSSSTPSSCLIVWSGTWDYGRNWLAELIIGFFQIFKGYYSDLAHLLVLWFIAVEEHSQKYHGGSKWIIMLEK